MLRKRRHEKLSIFSCKRKVEKTHDEVEIEVGGSKVCEGFVQRFGSLGMPRRGEFASDEDLLPGYP